MISFTQMAIVQSLKGRTVVDVDAPAEDCLRLELDDGRLIQVRASGLHTEGFLDLEVVVTPE